MKSSILPIALLSIVFSFTACMEDELNDNQNNDSQTNYTPNSEDQSSNMAILNAINEQTQYFTYTEDFNQKDFMDITSSFNPESELITESNSSLDLPNREVVTLKENHSHTSVQNVLQIAHSQSKPVFPKNPEIVYEHKVLTPVYIDSINEIEEIIPNGVFHDLSISYFQPLAEQLCGKAFFAKQSSDIIPVMSSILNSRLSPNTDIVLLIDKTGSMEDDIDNVKQGLAVIKDILSTYEGINVCVASYGDKNYHGDLWYNASPLTDDLSVIEDFIEGYSIIGNPDTPESVNDAIVKVTSEVDWTPGNDRLMLVIGDAPSQEGELSEYSLEEVVEHCAAIDVTFNLYPIIISMSGYTPPKAVSEVKANLYPNPASDFLNVSFDEYYDNVEYNLYDQNGKLLLSNRLYNTTSISIDVNSYPNGMYYLQLEDGNLDYMSVKKFIIQH